MREGHFSDSGIESGSHIGGGRRVVAVVGEGSGVVVDRGGRHGEAVIMRRIVDRASPSSV